MSTEAQGYNRDTLLAMLNCRIVEINYRKAEGDLRVVRGTLLDEYLPEKYRNRNQTEKEPENVVTLWDVDEAGWRSLRTDRIKEVL